MITFSPAKICTITATVALNTRIDIVDVAKHAMTSDDLLAVRISYAGGRSTICRGIPAKARGGGGGKRSFNNQVTFIVRRLTVPGHVCCKVFHNGTVHITGAMSQQDLDKSLEVVLAALRSIGGTEETRLMLTAFNETGVLVGLDHILYGETGQTLGWAAPNEDIYYLNDVGLVDLQQVGATWAFVQSNWTSNTKYIYDILTARKIGARSMKFLPGAGRRYFSVQDDEIRIGNVLVGRVETTLYECSSDGIDTGLPNMKTQLELGKPGSFPVRRYTAMHDKDAVPSAFCIHMVNAYFESSQTIDRHKLHQAFLEDGYYSRFDPCVNPGVNLRFYDNVGQARFGICECTRLCSCKKVSVRAFTSGSLIVAGLRDISHVAILHHFISDYYRANVSRIAGPHGGEMPPHERKAPTTMSNKTPSSDR